MATPDDPTAMTGRFVRSGEFWTVEFDGITCTLKSSGLSYRFLVRLLLPLGNYGGTARPPNGIEPTSVQGRN